MGLVTVGLNENNRASNGRITMLQPPGGRSNIISEICGPDVAEKVTAKMCHRMMQPPGGSSDILVSDSSSSSSRASSVCGDEGETKPVKKLYRLNSSIVLGDVTAEVISAPKPKTSIKVLNCDHPLVVDSIAALKIDTPDATHKNPPTADQDDLAEAVDNMASVTQSPSTEPVCDDISTTPPPTDTNEAESAPPLAPMGSALPSAPMGSAPPPSPKASPPQPPTEINLTNSNSAVFGANIPRLARRQPPGGRSTAFW